MPVICYHSLQLESQHVGPTERYSFIRQLIQHDHPTLREGFCTLLAIYAACEDDQELISLPQYLCLLYWVGCCPELRWLSHPTLQDVSWVCTVAGIGEGCIYFVHWLRKVIHLLKFLFPKGSKFCCTGTSQHHCLWINKWDSLVDHVHRWNYKILACNLVQDRLVYVDIDSALL